MEKQYFRPIETPIGTLTGRDAIYLDRTFYDNGKLIMEGGFNGHLASRPTNEHVFYRLTFTGVLALKMIDLDSSYHPMDEVEGKSTCFDEIINSAWIALLGGKVTVIHKHYHFDTYDDIFDIVCEKYELKTWTPYSIQEE